MTVDNSAALTARPFDLELGICMSYAPKKHVNRLNKAASAGPATICQMFVITVGITAMAAASAGGIATERSPMARVGNPIPRIPFTSPANKNVPATIATTIAAWDISNARRPR